MITFNDTEESSKDISKAYFCYINDIYEQTDRQTDKQTDRKIDRQTDRQTK